MIVVERAPPYLTVQDEGRFGYRSSGVPQAGAMDQWSFALANILAGNQRNAAALEWAVGGGSLRFEHDTIIALAGAEIDAVLDEEPVRVGELIEIRSGQILRVRGLTARRFLYLAVRGGIDCPLVLGSRSTYPPAGLGGIEGRKLANGDVLHLGATTSPQRHGAHREQRWGNGSPDYDATTVRVIPRLPNGVVNPLQVKHDEGDDAKLFAQFVERAYTVSAASDRMGYRLETGEPLDGARASITSEPVCAGTIQLTPSGQPIVLMTDAPTIGGYRIIGSVVSVDLPIIAQSLPGRTLRFEGISAGNAQALLEQRERALSQLVMGASARTGY
jgi:antagonist of KipI